MAIYASPPLFEVILAGGSGTRFWPLSRAQYPKQVLRLGSDSLRPAICARLLPRIPRSAWRWSPRRPRPTSFAWTSTASAGKASTCGWSPRAKTPAPQWRWLRPSWARQPGLPHLFPGPPAGHHRPGGQDRGPQRERLRARGDPTPPGKSRHRTPRPHRGPDLGLPRRGRHCAPGG